MDRCLVVDGKKLSSNAQFSAELQRVEQDSMVDLKSIFEVLSCISFKGTQYKEFRLIREMFKNLDTNYTPKSLKIPINYSFSLNFDM